MAAGGSAHLAHDGERSPGALATGGALSIQPLAGREVAKLPPVLVNVTHGPCRGYRMGPALTGKECQFREETLQRQS